MKYLLDKEKFLKEFKPMSVNKDTWYSKKSIGQLLSKHTKDLVEEPQHPSGMDHDRISIRNELIVELRE